MSLPLFMAGIIAGALLATLLFIIRYRRLLVVTNNLRDKVKNCPFHSPSRFMNRMKPFVRAPETAIGEEFLSLEPEDDKNE